jgi:TonB family protein
VGLRVHFTRWQHLLAADQLGMRNPAMNMRFAASCWLLVALTATTALAQTHPEKTRGSQPAMMRKRLRKAVAEPLDSNKVYFYVEQMPTLNGQNAVMASTAAITQYLVVLPAAPIGRVFVKFEVDKEGYVRHAEIIKGLRADLDSAVVTATRQLPRFTPGKQNGRVVRVSFTLPVTIPVQKQP